VTDLLIRDVPDHVVAAIDARAKQLGLSRTEYVRRKLTQVATGTEEAVKAEHLRRFAETFRDLDDAEVMAEAWQ
jgi:plasmid stability protein